MSVITLARRSIRPVPWRTIGLIALLALILAAGLALYAGSQSRPAPMLGLAANGLVAYEADGDIFTVDPVSGARTGVIVGAEQDRGPHFSLDGTRLVFLRAGQSGDIPVVADADGRNVLVTNTTGLTSADPESIMWSPDGRSVVILAGAEGAVKIHVIDAIDGGVRTLPMDFLDGEIYWRPPDGRAFMFVSGSEAANQLSLFSLDTGTIETLAVPARSGGIIRPSGWTADGDKFAYLRERRSQLGYSCRGRRQWGLGDPQRRLRRALERRDPPGGTQRGRHPYVALRGARGRRVMHAHHRAVRRSVGLELLVVTR